MSEAADNVKESHLSNIIGGLCFAALGIFLLVASQEFEDAGRSTPLFIGIGTVVLAVILVLSQFLKRSGTCHSRPAVGSLRRRLLFVFLTAIWVFLLPYLGFLISGIVMFVLVAVAVPKHSPWTIKGIGLHAAAGAVTTSAFWIVLTHLLSVPLPELSLF